MTLRALIIRLEGILADYDEFERGVLNDVFREAGLERTLGRQDFAELRKLSSRRDRIAHAVGLELEDNADTGDLSQLVAAMTRHASTLEKERLAAARFEPSPGIRETIVSARRESLRVAIISSICEPIARQVVRAVLGRSMDNGAVQVFGAADTAFDTEAGPRSLYARAIEELDARPHEILAFENTAEGTDAALAAGIHAVIAVSPHDSAFDVPGALFTIDCPATLIGLMTRSGTATLWPGDGEEIIAALRRAYSGHLDIFGSLQRSYAMKVADILKDKGSAVKTIPASESILSLAKRMKAEGVGAMVVMGENNALDGIISERDIANGLAVHGAALTNMTVSQLMTRAVVTCSAEETIAQVAKTMTQRRFRHMPVQKDAELIGLISIGDVLKYRLDELQLETNVLRDFVIARG